MLNNSEINIFGTVEEVHYRAAVDVHGKQDVLAFQTLLNIEKGSQFVLLVIESQKDSSTLKNQLFRIQIMQIN